MVALVLMGTDTASPDLTLLGLMAAYVCCGFISSQDAAAGFCNTSLQSVVALFMVAEGFSRTGGTCKQKNNSLYLLQLQSPDD